MNEKFVELKTRLMEAADLTHAGAVLYWDQATYMPPGGAGARARQSALLGRLAHEKQVDPAIGRLLDELEPYRQSLDPDSDEARFLANARRDFEKATKVPSEFIAKVFEHVALSYDAWTRARPANDFAAIVPVLEQTLEYSRQYSQYLNPRAVHLIDPLIDEADEGMTAADIQPLFAALRQELVPLVQAITAQPPADDSCLRKPFPEAEQIAFGEEVIRKFGYDFDRGRQDKTHHPFTINFGVNDVRITTRVTEDFFADAFFSTTHEAGHAMYEQGVNPAYDSSPLASGVSAGVHESQSRTWENIVSRSKPFWVHFYPRLQQIFPAQLGNVSLDTFYRAINKVEKSFIRVDADEVTYNLHVMLRFDFEMALLEGSLAIRDLAEAWRERFRADFGIVPPTDALGALQDVHWYSGTIGGAFQGYTLGNILSAQFYQAALAAHPQIPAQMAQGEFGTLFHWLRENIYQHGRKYNPGELVQRVCGTPMTHAPYIQYLKDKYGELYSL